MKQPPKYLDRIARAKWREMFPALPDCDAGTLIALEQFCAAWSCWRTADDDQQKIRWSRCCRQWATELKLTPKSRRSARATEAPTDPVLRLLKRG